MTIAFTDEMIDAKFESRRALLIASGVEEEQADKTASEYKAGLLFARLHYVHHLTEENEAIKKELREVGEKLAEITATALSAFVDGAIVGEGPFTIDHTLTVVRQFREEHIKVKKSLVNILQVEEDHQKAVEHLDSATASDVNAWTELQEIEHKFAEKTYDAYNAAYEALGYARETNEQELQS